MNTNKEIQKRVTKLEQLTQEQQTWILETALNSSLVDMVVVLRKQGIDTSPASLSRFIRRDREKRLLEERAESNGAIAGFAEAGKNGKLREGTLEAIRQRLYERTLESQNPDEARELFAAMAKEEVRLRELDLEARKVAALEQQVKLQELRIQVMAQQVANGGKMRVRATVAASEAVVDGAAQDGKGSGLLTQGTADGAPDQEKMKLVALLREVNEIANRGGTAEEKVMELRVRLGEEMKTIGVGNHLAL